MKNKNKPAIIKASFANTAKEWFNFCQKNTAGIQNILPISAEPPKSPFKMVNEGDEREICIFGTITPYAFLEWGEMDAISFYDQLQEMGDGDVKVRIKSNGGSVFEGIAMYCFLKEHKGEVTVRIEGNADSIASVIAMAGDKIEMSEASSMMIHNALVATFGNASELRDLADELDKISGQILAVYKRRTGNPANEIQEAMDKETRFTGEEAVAFGLADSLFEDEAEPEEPEEDPAPPEPAPVAEMSEEAFVRSQEAYSNVQALLRKCPTI